MSSFVKTKKIFPRDDPFPLKSWLELTYPLLKAACFDTFCLVLPRLQLQKEETDWLKKCVEYEVEGLQRGCAKRLLGT